MNSLLSPDVGLRSITAPFFHTITGLGMSDDGLGSKKKAVGFWLKVSIATIGPRTLVAVFQKVTASDDRIASQSESSSLAIASTGNLIPTSLSGSEIV